MKNLSLLIFLVFSFCAFAQVEKAIPPPPSPPKLVNDYVGMLTPEQVQYLENKLVAYDDSTSSQIAIVIVKDLGGYAAVDYSVALGRKWGVGGTKSNGIVILVSTGAESGQRDAFISIGYGLEGAIPDMIANAILESELIPNLKKGEYYTAFDRTTSSLIQAAAGEYKAPPGYGDRGKGKGGSGKLVLAIIILFIILSIFGGGRNKGGGFMSRRGYRGFSGPPVFFPGGWGSGGGGGGFGGGGGGGFGGFGGGSFGGGGAGGNW